MLSSVSFLKRLFLTRVCGCEVECELRYVKRSWLVFCPLWITSWEFGSADLWGIVCVLQMPRTSCRSRSSKILPIKQLKMSINFYFSACRCYESQRCKCFQYWPAIEGQSLRFTTISPSASSVGTPDCSGWSGIGATGGPGNSGTMAPSKKKALYGLARRSASEVSNSNKFVFEVTHLSSQPGEDYTCTKLQIKDVKVGSVLHFMYAYLL